jgi:ribokinase
MALLSVAGVKLDVVVGSASDAGERYPAEGIEPPPGVVVLTEGKRGGSYRTGDGATGRWPSTPVPRPQPGVISDSYGCGDSFAGGLTFGLGAGLPLDGALELAARCGAACLSGRGPYGAQLDSSAAP